MLFSLSLIPLMLSIMFMINNIFIMMDVPLMLFMSCKISVNIMLDWMSLLFSSTVMFISSMIIMFSYYYMSKTQLNQFLTLMLMFIISMQILILSNNLFLMLLGWDGLGLTSYILVIYYQDFKSAASGTITILSNRIGDITILMAISLMMMTMNWNLMLNSQYMKITMILLMIAACSKSAQFPFSAWLPMAMAAPTPISALVHSSTLVTAGVFMGLRVMNNPHPSIMLMIMTIASSTAIYASMSANWEQDIKKIIALSTLSQIAMMMFALSIMMIMIAFLHLIIHALFKSTMFLCAGLMIHESKYQDMRMMGMNMYSNPITNSTLGITTMALMGIPFMSGFFSKDAIIESMISTKMTTFNSILMIMSIGMTTSYSLRMIYLSNKNYIKNHPLSKNHSSLYSNGPLLIMTPLTIMSGSLMSWMMMSEQLFYLNNMFKILITITLMLGMLIGFNLSNKNKNIINLGKSAISLWFINFLSMMMAKILYPTTWNYIKNDKNWQEKYGPQKLYNINTNMSKIPEMMKMMSMMFIMMITIIPLMIY
uniref:NADH-ubiquinone oxidoreductase chain 5 n=1 Tax=Philodromus sp. TaxID=2975155 RepID=A0A977Q8X4_9ARAC|nr:NADH dehydrogenase subunit 5 [Philodromus sp.]